MNALRNLTIKQRLAMGFGGVSALIVALACVTWVLLEQVRNDVVEIVDLSYPKLQLAVEIRDALNVQARMVRNAIIGQVAKETKEVERALAESDAAATANNERLRKLDALIASKSGKDLFKAVSDARNEYAKVRTEVMRLAREGKTDESSRLLFGEMRDKQTRLFAALEKLVRHQEERLVEDGADAKQQSVQTERIAIAAAGIAVALSLFAGWVIARSIIAPVGEAVRVAQAVAAGDLSVAIENTSKDETGRLLAALRAMTENLADIVGKVRAGSDSVATASAQIAQGTQDLSSRTEEQASALEQTAATMSQLGSTVRNTAENARQADQLASSASEVAQQGGEVVGRVVQTMKSIDESSKRIAEIIAVIDGIAFQTNILALNAAVEAARAGEQGRGFAVVAGEVRNLAQRSAEAAKEIKSLITASVERVAEGSVLVDQAGQKVNDIVTSIRRVSEVVGEITAAAQEQSTGVNQVGEAVSQMDTVTQQNAALVEESAAAAESLKNQAQQLVQAVAVFHLGQRDPAAAAGRPATMAHVSPPIADRQKPPAGAALPEPRRAAPAKAESKSAPKDDRQSAPARTEVAAAASAAASEEWATF